VDSGNNECPVWWLTTVIPVLERLREEDRGFEASLDYIARPCLRKQSKGSGVA
jgi:hypothetical protein